MQFGFPLVLWGLLALAIPILIHLLHFRRYKRLLFPHTAFLAKVQEQKRNRNRLRDLLILFCRLALMGLMVLAFAEPFIPGEDATYSKAEGKYVSIYIDNGFPMEAEGPQGQLLDQAMRMAADLTETLAPNDHVQILSNDFSPDAFRWVNPAEARKLIAAIRPSPKRRNLHQIIVQQQDMLNQAGGGRAFLLSDFRKGMSSTGTFEPDTLNRYHLIPLKANSQSNLYADSAWFESPESTPGSEAKLHVRVRNSGQETVQDIPVDFQLNGKAVAPASVTVPGGGSAEAVFHFRLPGPGWHTAEIYLDDETLRFDDVFYLSFPVRDQIRVLEVYESGVNSCFKRLFGQDSMFAFTQAPVQRFDQGQLTGTDLVILHGVKNPESGFSAALQKFVEEGGTVAVIPPDEWNADAYKHLEQGGLPSPAGIDTARRLLQSVTPDHPFFQDVFDRYDPRMDLPWFKQSYILRPSPGHSYIKYFSFADGHTALGAWFHGQGKWVLMASSLNENHTNFSRHALFVPTFLKIAFQSVRNGKLYYWLGAVDFMNSPNTGNIQDPVFRMEHQDGGTSLMPSRRLMGGKWQLILDESIEKPGFYDLILQDEIKSVAALNYNREDSDLRSADPEELVKTLKNAGLVHSSTAKESSSAALIRTLKSDTGTSLWRYFVMAALFFFLVEILLIRLWKT